MLRCRAMTVVRFGVFDLDLASGELHRLGRRVHLTAQASTVLVLLAGRPHDLVTREELKARLWADGTFVDFDRGLNFCVSAARAALRDDAHSPRFIETVPRRGYRFIAATEIVRVERAAPADEVLVLPDGAFRPGLASLARWSVAVAVLALAAAQRPAAPLSHSRTTAASGARAAFNRALQSPGDDAASLRRNVASLKLATQLDPRFAEAHYALADLYLNLAVRHELPITAALAEAESSARRAIALEDEPESHQVLATALLFGAWDMAGARDELARAVALAPKWDMGLAAYARLLSAVGDDHAAMDAIDRAETVSPTCELILYDAGAIYARAGRDVEAIGKLRSALDLGPPRTMTPAQWRVEVEFRLLRIAAARGRWNAARDAASAILEANGVAEPVRRGFAADDPREAVDRFLRRSVEKVRAAAASVYVPPTRYATLYALLGDRDAALDWLETAADERDPELLYVLRDPDFARLRGAPRFTALERRIQGVRAVSDAAVAGPPPGVVVQ
jgi:DNA-binding winged helix-turn-helix (wHTH) protein/tetratricopeptide (TPR) repeat protein